MAEQQTPVVFLHAGRAALPSGRRGSGNPEGRRPRDLAGAVGGAGGAVGRRQSRRCCTSPVCSNTPTAARSFSTASRRRAFRTRRAPACGATRSASSIRRTTCCRNSPRSRTSCCRRWSAACRRREARKRASELLSYLGLGERLTHRPAELSGGEQQRVAIARAVANVPRLLLADEPTGNLDPRTSDHVFHALSQLIRASGLTVMLATHNMEIAARMDRRVTIRDGLIVELPDAVGRHRRAVASNSGGTGRTARRRSHSVVARIRQPLSARHAPS